MKPSVLCPGRRVIEDKHSTEIGAGGSLRISTRPRSEQEGHREQSLDRDRSRTHFKVECSHRRAEEDEEEDSMSVECLFSTHTLPGAAR